MPVYIWALVFLAAVGIPLATCVALYRGGRAAERPPRTAFTLAALCGAVWIGWIALSARLADLDLYRPKPAAAPWFVLAFVGALTVALTATRIPAVSRTLATPAALARLTLPHTLRVAGASFLIAAALGRLPFLFALPAGLGDIAIGLEAPFVARRLERGDGRRVALWFNALGLFDIVVAVTIAVLCGIAPHQILPVSPSTQDLTLLPLALIPTTAVPLLVALHLISLRRLMAHARTVPGTSERPQAQPISAC
ncbi:hypothetical protein KDL01_31270 [Actinospica durhamensis]|uniref:Uncharacterized protein n=1 Tax=Actinospica durhamensis TaxID=1508375 RepID=A0A941ETI8_9ACTN|nr:hypothetical protein [Actinospica durhamensis]MBR7837797.1 hypothetical protein [Actinospica durhamensis]